jgi:hypothetical protein
MTRIEVPGSSFRGSSLRRNGPRRGARLLMIVLLLMFVGAGLWTWLTLAWAYADGERAGILQRFVRRGWLCKTQEGEIALYYGGGQYLGPGGTSPQVWDFSVRDKSVAAQLGKAVGHRVQLHYTEHPGIPTHCFADTRFFVDRVTVTDDQPVNQSPPASTAPPSVPDVRPGTTLAPPPPPAATEH